MLHRNKKFLVDVLLLSHKLLKRLSLNASLSVAVAAAVAAAFVVLNNLKHYKQVKLCGQNASSHLWNLSVDCDGWRLNKNISRGASVQVDGRETSKLFKMCNIRYLSYRVCSSDRFIIRCFVCVCVCIGTPVHALLVCCTM